MKSILTLGALIWAVRPCCSQTRVSGTIYSNSTWTKANSPYIVDGNIVVNSGVSLNIEPGVTVKTDSAFSIEIKGELNAIGTAEDSIFFEASSLTPNPDAWEGIKGSGADLNMKYCVVKNAHVGLTAINTADFNIRYCHFTQNRAGADFQGLNGMEDCRFSYNQVGLYNSSSLKRLHFVGNSYMGMLSYAAELSESIFEDNYIAASGSGKLSRSTFRGNHIAVSDPYMSLRCNDIRDNDTGILMTNRNFILDTILDRSNQLCSNHFNLVYTYAEDLTIPGFCWCESDSEQIAAGIIDGNDNGSSGKVKFMPPHNCSISTPVEAICSRAGNNIAELSRPSFNIYPNPANNAFTVQSIEEFQDAELRIFNSLGENIYILQNFDGIELYLDLRLPQGLYLVRIIEKGKAMKSERLMVLN